MDEYFDEVGEGRVKFIDSDDLSATAVFMIKGVAPSATLRKLVSELKSNFQNDLCEEYNNIDLCKDKLTKIANASIEQGKSKGRGEIEAYRPSNDILKTAEKLYRLIEEIR